MKALISRMLKRKLLAIPVVAALAAGAAFGGVVLAQGGEDGEKTMSRVAQILEMDEQQVTDAFQDAVRTSSDEAVQAKLDMLVEKERLTQEQADEIEAWFDDRPEELNGFGMGNVRGAGPGVVALAAETLGVEEEIVADALSQAKTEFKDEKIQERLALAVESGKLTQEQADAIAERLANAGPGKWREHAGKGRWFGEGRFDRDGRGEWKLGERWFDKNDDDDHDRDDD